MQLTATESLPSCWDCKRKVKKMVEMNLRDNKISENFKAIEELRRTGMFTDEELQEMYDKQVEADKKEGAKNE